MSTIIAKSNYIPLAVADGYFVDESMCDPARTKERTGFVLTNKRAQIADLDTLPTLDRSLIDYRKYHEYIGQSGIRNCFTVQGSRGCPWRCIYCDVVKLSPRLYRRSPANIFDEVRRLHAMGARDIEFIDDIFNVNRKDFIEFFRLVEQSRLRINFYFQSGLRGDILDEEAIDAMMAGGVKSVNISLETASPRLQKLIKKNLKIDKFHRHLLYLVENYPDVILGVNAMHGFPGETEEEALETVAFIKSIRWIHFPQLHNVRIFPNSVLEDIALAHGITRKQIAESLTLPYNAIPTTFTLDPDFSRKVRLDFVRSYVLNRDRLRYTIQHQLKKCTEDELIYKYKSYFPTRIETFDDIFRFAKIKRSEIDFSVQPTEPAAPIDYQALARKRPPRPARGATRPFRFVFVDLSQFYSSHESAELRIVEPPLGGMALLTYLNDKLGADLDAKLLKSFVDFDSNDELLKIIADFQPDLIGVRTLSYYKNFFNSVVNALKAALPDTPIIAGGPHPSISYDTIFGETGIDVVAIGEGEVTLHELVAVMIGNDYKMPRRSDLLKIDGLALPCASQGSVAR